MPPGEEIHALRASSSKLTKKIRNLETALGGKGDRGSGLVQMHADFREKYKDKVKYLAGESMEHGHYIDSLMKRVASLEEQTSSARKSCVLMVFQVPEKRAKRNSTGMHLRRRRKDIENLFT
jgi:hypothetical protein